MPPFIFQRVPSLWRTFVSFRSFTRKSRFQCDSRFGDISIETPIEKEIAKFTRANLTDFKIYTQFVNINEKSFGGKARSLICDFYITFHRNDHYAYLAETWNHCQRNNVHRTKFLHVRTKRRSIGIQCLNFISLFACDLFMRATIYSKNWIQWIHYNAHAWIFHWKISRQVWQWQRGDRRPIDYNREARNCSRTTKRTTFPSKLFIRLSTETRINRPSAVASLVPKQSSESIAAAPTYAAALRFPQKGEEKKKEERTGRTH